MVNNEDEGCCSGADGGRGEEGVEGAGRSGQHWRQGLSLLHFRAAPCVFRLGGERSFLWGIMVVFLLAKREGFA